MKQVKYFNASQISSLEKQNKTKQIWERTFPIT